MIPSKNPTNFSGGSIKCDGCEYELEEAYYQFKKFGYHVATSDDYPMSFLDRLEENKHIGIILVDNDGNIKQI